MTHWKCRLPITGLIVLLMCCAACFDVLPQAIGFGDAQKSYTEETMYRPVKIHRSTRKVTALGEPGTFEQAQAIT